jgi:quercetin dioxygenase-like cupin family protein
MKVIAAFFKAGQFIPVHTPGVDVVFYIIDGEAELVAGNERLNVGPGELIAIPSGVKRGIKALTELSALHIVQPVPSETDHAEVHAKLSKGVFE